MNPRPYLSILQLGMCFRYLSGSMLKVDPSIRPNVEDVHAELVALAFDRNLDLKSAFVVSLILPITHKMEIGVAKIVGQIAEKAVCRSVFLTT